MSTLLQLEWKVEGSHYGLWANERLRDQVAKREWQVAELQEPLQEGVRPVYRICWSRMYLGEDENKENVQPQVPIPSDI